jgi:hypothetical protein
VSVDIVKMKHAHSTTGHQARTQAGTRGGRKRA